MFDLSGVGAMAGLAAAPFTGGASLAPSLINAGATLLGGAMGAQQQDKANSQNIALQKEFAQNSIQWKVQDAKKAGVHPLFAMGASTNSPSFAVKGENHMGNAVRDAVNKMPSEIETLQKQNIQADIALKMARAAEVAKRTQAVNSQQDVDLVKIMEQDNPKPNKKLHAARQPISTIIGGLLPNKAPGYIDANRLPERYGDEAKDFLGLVNLWNDFWRNKGKQLYNAKKPKILNDFENWVGKKRTTLKDHQQFPH